MSCDSNEWEFYLTVEFWDDKEKWMSCDSNEWNFSSSQNSNKIS